MIPADAPEVSPMQLVARTADLDEIRSVMTGMFGTHRLMMPAHARPDAQVEAREVGQLLLARVRYGMPIEVEVDETRVAWTITQIVRGTGAVDRRRADACGDVLTHSPDWRGRIGASADLLFDNLRIPVAKLDATCRILLGAELDRPVLLEPFAGGGSAQAARFGALIQGLKDLPHYGGRAGESLARAVEESFLLELLTLWPHSYSRYLDRAQPSSRAIVKACDFIDANLHQPIGLPEIAAAAHVGVRALTLAFDKRFGVAPGRYLRQRRLDAAREVLRRPAPGVTVTAVAMDLQFGNLGQFARYYRQRFGELPSATGLAR